MRLSRFAISNAVGLRAASVAWLLTQTLWVGGLWLLHFLLLPAIAKTGLAPLLIEELDATLRPLLVGLAAVCAGLQVLILLIDRGLTALWRDSRGQLLLVVILAAASYLLVRSMLPGLQQWLLFSYLAMAFCGLLLVLQPVPRGQEPPGTV
ncbi:hypothetical protein SAMN05216600_11542 [Pseudomonas cuatrocienegasensis]|jgi:hypothetical protein|uniref:DUF4149 domain-containing protein n=1 Tax=Pseudomonas cuatrocienegasensis TaxID=543360 RepID=A0ABY1BLC7_9PSED|nr:hypothetical protein SAMN05216600_11542 [Pseudomonas cuatrocienegasensis]